MLLFVYGSLKEGFPNFHVNKGRRVPGRFTTVNAYPLYVADGVLPCLLLQPGRGTRVTGQLFEVDDAQLAAMDALERVGQPGGYARERIEVQPQAGDAPGGSAPPIEAWVYVQHEARLAPGGTHVGPLGEYTLEDAQRLSW